jgi:hypothetical protein
MLKRIALAAVFVVSAALAGAHLAKAKSTKFEVVPPAPKGFCFPPGCPC